MKLEKVGPHRIHQTRVKIRRARGVTHGALAKRRHFAQLLPTDAPLHWASFRGTIIVSSALPFEEMSAIGHEREGRKCRCRITGTVKIGRASCRERVESAEGEGIGK